MKIRFTLFALLLQLLSPAYSQEAAAPLVPNLKYGKPSQEELQFTTYAPDTTAAAVYLFHQGHSYFTYRNSFRLVTEHWVRIKVLKPQGVTYADVSVPFYAPIDQREDTERADEIEGYTYNMENGKSVKTPMKRESVSIERVNNRIKVLKFSLPAVRQGSVIEYHYKIQSDYFAQIDNWMMQEEIPMLYNQYKTTIPSILVYNIELRGKDHIQIKQRDSSMRGSEHDAHSTASNGRDFSITAQETTFTCRNLPAIRQDESYSWCPEDYKVQVSFDLQGTQYPGSEYKPYSQQWADVDKQLLNPDNSQFGAFLSYSNPFRDEAKEVFAHEMSFEEKVIRAFRLLKKQLAWNGRYQLYSSNLDKVIRQKSGSNADLNFIFIGMLKDFGLYAFPVVMSRRSTGMLPHSFPSLQKLNTFVVAVLNPENQKYVFLDSSMDIPALSVLPLDLCVSKARLLSPQVEESKKWINLMEKSESLILMTIKANVEGNLIKGHRTTILHGQEAVDYQKKMRQEQDSIASGQISGSIRTNKIGVTNLHVKQTDSNPGIIDEQFDFTLKAEQAGNRLYINPMLYPQLKSNPFIQAERVLPVEFPYPYKFLMQCILTLPQGYEVEEMPQPYAIRTEADNLQCKYIIQKQDNNTVVLNYIFHLKGYLFMPQHYNQLKEMWGKVVEKNNALIVLKRTE